MQTSLKFFKTPNTGGKQHQRTKSYMTYLDIFDPIGGKKRGGKPPGQFQQFLKTSAAHGSAAAKEHRCGKQIWHLAGKNGTKRSSTRRDIRWSYKITSAIEGTRQEIPLFNDNNTLVEDGDEDERKNPPKLKPITLSSTKVCLLSPDNFPGENNSHL